MSQQPPSTNWIADKGRRRSLRVLLTVPVTVRGLDAHKKGFHEETKTLVVNAHGALVMLSAEIKPGQVLNLTNNTTQENLDCKVVYQGQAQAGKTQVGIEFLKPAPAFWQINFPPEDWKAVPD
jgi:hypothetical protein